MGNSADFVQGLVACGFLCLHDQIAHTELLDERHDFLLRAGADRKHGDHGGNSENHSQHGEERAQFVNEQVLESQAQVGKPLPNRKRVTKPRGRDLIRGAHRGAPTGPAELAGFAEPPRQQRINDGHFRPYF